MKLRYKLCSQNPCIEKRPGVRASGIWPRRVGSLLLVAIPLLGGCGILGVKPWDHDLLAEQPMQVDAYPLQTAIDDHIYFSKEASSGGRSFAGGGCGCN